MANKETSATQPNCYKCCHFFITHEPAHPYGCMAMNFKSKILPAKTVWESSGMRCQLYSAKK